jgi:hypothetical protein
MCAFVVWGSVEATRRNAASKQLLARAVPKCTFAVCAICAGHRRCAGHRHVLPTAGLHKLRIQRQCSPIARIRAQGANAPGQIKALSTGGVSTALLGHLSFCERLKREPLARVAVPGRAPTASRPLPIGPTSSSGIAGMANRLRSRRCGCPRRRTTGAKRPIAAGFNLPAESDR